jgi:cytidine deaminase
MKILAFLALFSIYPLFASCIPQKLLNELIEKAVEGQKNAYAPYSNYLVGAAVLTKSGKIYSGCNVENASYGLGNCAERTAVFKAVSEGEKEIEIIVIVTRDGGMSCGACRQVLNEFNPNMKVIAVDKNYKVRHEAILRELLPYAFGPSNLDK